jgi:type IX secretion system PorP/SprF family membrane protein
MKLIRKKTLFFIVSSMLLAASQGYAQDIHFSQFYNAPLLVNPANTGNFVGRYRVSTSYKNQWQSISNTYKSTFASADLFIPSKNLGVGLTFFNDKSGKSKMGITQANISLSYNLKINGSNHFITGLQYGVGQRSMRLDDLKWDSQFNGSAYDPSLASGEQQYSDSYSFMDVSFGMVWNYTASHSQSRFKNSLGIAMFHANQPRQSLSGTEKLYSKFVFNLNNQFKLADRNIYILPQLLYSKQGPYNELNVGSLVKFTLGEEGGDLIRSNRIDKRYSTASVYVGGQLRYKDAVVLMSAFEFRKGLLLSVSYDLNISKLQAASRLRGGVELALTYRGYF